MILVSMLQRHIKFGAGNRSFVLEEEGTDLMF